MGQVYLPLPTSGNGAAQGVTMQGIALSDRSRVLICPALRYIPFFIHLTCICKEGGMYQSKIKKFARGSGIDARILHLLFAFSVVTSTPFQLPAVMFFFAKDDAKHSFFSLKL